jgi:sulfite exporter TauE/SafE
MEEKIVHPCCVAPTLSLKTRLWRAALAVSGICFITAAILPSTSGFVPQAQSGASLLALLGLGAVASVSTCLGTTGAFFLAESTKLTKRADILALHFGRFIAFVFGGALLGQIGGALASSPLFYGILGLALGGVFLIIGMQMLDIAPAWMRKVTFMPETKIGSSMPGLMGAATFFFPCGFTQTAQGLALASGSPVVGAMLLGAFALGTVPVLVGISLFGSSVSVKTPWLKLATGALLFVFAIGQLDGGLTVLGSPFTFGGVVQQTTAMFGIGVPVAQAQEQVVSMTVAYGVFSPNRFTIKRGVPVLWAVEGKDVSGCASTLISPRLGITRSLAIGTNIIRFTPKETGSIPFSCSMGMIRGSFTVVP